MVLKLILRDTVFWLILAGCALAVATGAALRPTGPGSEGKAPLTGQPVVVHPADDPALAGIVNGTFPKVDGQLTLGQAFSRYPWFTGPAKWIARGAAASRTAVVTVPLRMPLEAEALGAGSDSYRVFYVAEFGYSGDLKSFRPLSSAVEVRDAENKLRARVPDPEFILVRRVMRGVEPGVSLGNGVAKGR
ncbi:hypothetical protein NNJEOMEG_01114 [Fundidesulfovibrio magnetotacticus]|uniref:Uncharacterized protein n=1 Tax=Fundidesulfovibrio magnetotacticus TaxID=2730080 RepID=A0A6V8LKR2_9BACT|nr:hypothetical protein [Fundidesulfovibrio magnetotacticus]GFK93283.1 hypothetical protein NNJEOMEG_01114 [Fundidesulfovibrio magnetotacticus]